MPDSKLIIITRPREDADALANELQRQGLHPHIFPALKIVERPEAAAVVQEKIQSFHPDSVAVTSRHALFALPDLPLPLYLVGQKTAEAARKMGHGAHIRYVGEDSSALIAYLGGQLKSGSRLLYLRGKDVTRDLAQALPQHRIEPVIAYEAVAVESIPSMTQVLLAEHLAAAITFYSIRSLESVDALLSLHTLHDTRYRLPALCFSAAIAARARELGWKRIGHCPVPAPEAMVQLIESLYA